MDLEIAFLECWCPFGASLIRRHRQGDVPEGIGTAIKTFAANFIATSIDSPPEL
jgi:hypothetical protein